MGKQAGSWCGSLTADNRHLYSQREVEVDQKTSVPEKSLFEISKMAEVWGSRDTKWGRISEICAEKLDIISEYHNSPLVYWLHAYRRRRQTLKSAIFATFGPTWHWPWPWPWTLALIDLYLHTKFRWNWKNLFVDGLTYGQTEGHWDRVD